MTELAGIDLARLAEPGLAAAWRSARPYAHVVVDGLVDEEARRALGPGLLAERHHPSIEPARPAASPCFTVVRADPRRHPLRLFAARSAGGGRRTLPQWARETGMIGLVNASMYREDDHSTGLLVARGAVTTATDNAVMGGFFAFDPVDPADPPVAVHGRSCDGFDLAALRGRYRSIVQNYRLLDCDSRPIPWKDEKVYSAAAIGIDAAGNVVLVASRAAHRMTDFAELLAAPEVGLRAALYVEGGPEASLLVQAGEHTIQEIGSFETGFQEDDANAVFWPIPNVLAFGPG
jgi:hypothetical protein